VRTGPQRTSCAHGSSRSGRESRNNGASRPSAVKKAGKSKVVSSVHAVGVEMTAGIG